MILRIVIVIVVLIAAILIFAANRPDTFHIQRSRTITAPPEKVFALINDLHNWPRWAPLDREDSSLKRSFSGAPAGVGAVSEWEGRGNSGKGAMTITESDAPRKIVIQVDWVRPFQARNMNEFALEPDGTGTKVTWSMTGPNLFIMKLMSTFTNMDRMMGKHFDDGLENLKTVGEH
jgi:uncharacterized protein YndB with AHSA1/START domain